jgi:hypothetical protein
MYEAEQEGDPVIVPLNYITCKKCKFGRYCSRKCLVLDWAEHKEICMPLCDAKLSMEMLEGLLKNYAVDRGKRKINLFKKEVGNFSEFPEAIEYCLKRIRVAQFLWEMALEKNQAYLWKESAMHYQEVLRLDQCDRCDIVDIVPAILIGAKEYRKAYIFCLWWAHADKNCSPFDWPIENAEPGAWIWGPICCDMRLFEDPFDFNLEDHDPFDSLTRDDYRTNHLVAMALVKHITLKSKFEYETEGKEEEFEYMMGRQPAMLERMLKEIDKRNYTVLRSVLNPSPFLDSVEDIGFLKDRVKKIETAYNLVKLYSHLYERHEALSVIQKVLGCERNPDYSCEPKDLMNGRISLRE